MSSKDGILNWVTIHPKNDGSNGNEFGVDIPDLPSDDDLDSMKNGGGDVAKKAKKPKSDKRLSVERIYQKKTQLEHILLRPDTYIGSIEAVTQGMWVYDDLTESMQFRELSFCPGMFKIYDEILVNAADNKQRDSKMNCIKIDIDPENNKIKVWNNGKGIPVVHHKEQNMYVPTLIFGHLLTSSNFNDEQKKTTGGRNGFGAKLCNVFSTKFTVETSCQESKKMFKQVWENNMAKVHEPKIVPNKGEDYTCVTFQPDLPRFRMESLSKDMIDLFTRRAYDIAACSPGVKVFLNGKKLPIKDFKGYIELFIKGKVDDTGTPIKLVHEKISDRWEIGVALSDKGPQSVSFCNSIATSKGGRHVDYIVDQLTTKLIEVLKKKTKKGETTIKPFQVKNHIWVFVNCLIENPTFDSQTKENMTLQAKSFGSKCVLNEGFVKKTSQCGIVESIQSWMKFKAQEKMNKACGSKKSSKLKGMAKLDDANDAGKKNARNCTLILTEGDSAKTLAVSGLGVIGRDTYGVFPLRGKVLNVRDATPKQIMENVEINNVIKICGLRYKEKYDTPESLNTLRYGKIMIMTDQDQDGSHIKGLLINFLHNSWPNLLRHGFLEQFITPIVKVTKKVNKKEQSRSFYSLPEFEEWKENTSDWNKWTVKYYKGLGTSTAKEAKEYFSDMNRHRIPFKYGGPEDDSAVLLAFSKKKIEDRKEWLTNWMEERKRRTQLGLPELYLYGKETKRVTFNEFVNRELILFSNMDNVRSIPNLMDGFKPGQRKVMFTCFKRNIVKDFKVAQLAGSVGEHSAYHHGEASLMGTIIGLAQNFVGSNNINCLVPQGQFGTRLMGGKDAASPRYIFTFLSPLAKLIFKADDEPLLKAQTDDNMKIEPETYMPIIPMVLVNGADGIGTGWATKVPNHNPREIVKNIRRMIDGLEPRTMIPWYKGFNGTIEPLEDNRYVCNGEISMLDDQTFEINELPIKTWTQGYKESVLEPFLEGGEKTPQLITDYKEHHTDTSVKFEIKMSAEKLAKAEDDGLHKIFKLQTTMSSQNMVLFDYNGCIKKYNSVEEIMREFFDARLDMYQRRKDYMEGFLSAESLQLDNKARFIMEKIEDKFKIENKAKKDLVRTLLQRGYDSDPVRAWKKAQAKLEAIEDGNDDEEESDSEEDEGPDYNYLLSMQMWSLTKEKKDELLKQRDTKTDELYKLKKKSPTDLWTDDLDVFMEELDKYEAMEEAEAKAEVPIKDEDSKKRKKMNKIKHEYKPSPHGIRVEPRIDPALRIKAEKAAASKKRKQDKKGTDAGTLNFDSDSDDDMVNTSLSDRLAGQLKNSDIKKPKKEVKPKAEPKEPKEKKPRIKSGSPRPKKGEKKRNPWSDDSEEDKSDAGSDASMDGSFSAAPRERAAPRRAAAVKAKYASDASDSDPFKSDEDNSDVDMNGDTSDHEAPKKKSAPAKKPAKDILDDMSGEEISSEEEGEQLTLAQRLNAGKTIPAKKPAPTKVDSDSEDDRISSVASSTAPSKNNSPESQTGFKSNHPPSPVMLGDSDGEKPAPKKKVLGKKQASGEDKPAAKKKAPVKKKVVSAPVVVDDISSLSDDSMPKSKSPSISDISDDDDSYMPKAKSPPPKKKAAPKKKDSDDDFGFGGSDEDKPKKKPAPKKKAPPKKKAGSDSEDDFGISDDKPKKKTAPKKKAAPAKKSAGSDDDDDIFGAAAAKPAPKKKTVAPKKTAPKKRAKMSDSDMSEDDFAAKKQKKKSHSDEDEDFGASDGDDPSEYIPRATTGRSRAPVKYNFGAEEVESAGSGDSDY